MTTPGALRTLLANVIDYAGVFPPASLDMRSSVANYAAYRAGGQSWMLGRFVAPAARLGEFASASAEVRSREASPARWPLCAVAGPALGDDLERLEAFNVEHDRDGLPARAAVELFEARVGSAGDVRALASSVPRGVRLVCEVAVGGSAETLRAMHAADAMAKVRTGGLTADAIPSSEVLAEFLLACRSVRVAFKATAGLHHPVRREQRVTGTPGAPRAVMHGFLNVFLAAALVDARVASARAELQAQLVRLLDEDDASAFSFSDEGVRWRDVRLSEAELASSRARFALSFGSCSLDEPIADLRELGYTV